MMNELPPSQETLTEEQQNKVLDFLKKGAPVTNFEVQRILFGEKLNPYASVAIKKFLLDLHKDGQVGVTGQKRGRRYLWSESTVGGEN